MDVSRTESLLSQIVAIVGNDVLDTTEHTRLRDLAAKALCQPMTMEPHETRELARAILNLVPSQHFRPIEAATRAHGA